jgi:hypothetical protein
MGSLAAGYVGEINIDGYARSWKGEGAALWATPPLKAVM